MKARFRVGKVETNLEGCPDNLKRVASSVSDVLKTLEYIGRTKKKNSKELSILFDSALFDRLDSLGWDCQRDPVVNSDVLEGHSGSERADAIVRENGTGCFAVMEIEKANKKTLWFDFIKLWMYIESRQAEVGLLVVPFNYAHKSGEWHLFEEANRCKFFLRRFAEVAEGKLDLIGIIGYEQEIFRDNEFRLWDSREFNLLKSMAE